MAKNYYAQSTMQYREALDKGGTGVDLQEISKRDIKKASARAGLGKRINTEELEVESEESMETRLMGRMADAYQRVQDAPTTRERFQKMLIERGLVSPDIDMSDEEIVLQKEFTKRGLVSPDTDMTDEEIAIQKEFSGRFSKGLGSRPKKDSVEDFIASFEASEIKDSYKAYWDNKQYSIGFGTKAKSKDEVITHEEALARLSKETAKARKSVIGIMKKYGYDFTDSQVDALTSFGYNLGATSLEEVTKKGTRGIEEISDAMLEYVYADGKKQDGLIKRRKAEYNLFNDL